MTVTTCKAVGFRILSVAIAMMGFSQFAFAGAIDTSYLAEQDARDASIARVESYLAREDVRQQLIELGVDQSEVEQRVQYMSYADLQMLEGRIEQQVAGGGVIGVIGTVFLVLVILELVGVTDIFKAF